MCCRPMSGRAAAVSTRVPPTPIYQNIGFIERYDPEYVVILSGDHIYKMNYAKMLEAHKRQKADCTIAVIEVPMEEASRFGIMNINPDGTIY